MLALGFLCAVLCSDAPSCPTLSDPMDYSPPDSSVHGISQERILEWAAISFCRESSWSRDQNFMYFISCIGRRILYHFATWEALDFPYIAFICLQASSFYINLLSFYQERVLNLVKCFPASVEIIVVFVFFLNPSISITHWFNLCAMNYPCSLGINPPWSWCMVVFICS